MSRRQIGQEAFGFGVNGGGRRSSLDDLCNLIDWAPIEQCLSVISCAAKGEPAWPPLALPDNPGEVFADSAYRGSHFGDAVRARGGRPRIVATGMWGRD